MSKNELDTAVREYLHHAGCAETAQIVRALGAGAAGVTRTAVTASLRRIGASFRVLGNWAFNPAAVDRLPKVRKHGRVETPYCQRRYPGGSFTVWTLSEGGAS